MSSPTLGYGFSSTLDPIYDHIYVSESQTGGTADNTNSASRDWYHKHTPYMTFTTTYRGSFVTIYITNVASYSNSKFRIQIRCVDCCSMPEISGCPANGELEVGSTVDLSVSDGATVTSWESSNSGVATVEGGTVTAVATGQAVITANVGDDGGFCETSARCTINVVDPPCSKISDPMTFSLSEASGSVAAGNSTSVALTNGTGQLVAWHSDDETVATVTPTGGGATISGVSEGRTTITATVAGWDNGSGTTYCDTTLTYTITVNDAACDEAILMGNIADKMIECGKTYCFYDSGGPGGNYGDNESFWADFTTDGSWISIRFVELEETITSGRTDVLYVIDGTGYTPVLAYATVEGTGTSPNSDNPYFTMGTTYTCSSGYMRVRWYSNGSGNNSGWKAYITAGGCCNLEAKIEFGE